MANRLLAPVQEARRIPPWWLALLVTVAVLLLGSLVGAVILLLLDIPIPGMGASMPPGGPVVDGVRFAAGLVAAFAPVLLLLALWVRAYEGRPMHSLGLQPAGAVGLFGRGFAVGLALFGLVTMLLVVGGAVQLVWHGGSGLDGTLWIALLLILAGWTVQGSTEEILTRGWLLPVLGVRYSVWMGIAVSSVSFAVLHLLNPSVSFLAAVNLCLVGLLFAFYALWEEGVWGVCGLHVAWNFAQGNLFGFQVSGFETEVTSLWRAQVTGSPLWTGGAFGPEAGLAVTLVLAVAAAGWWWRWRLSDSPA